MKWTSLSSEGKKSFNLITSKEFEGARKSGILISLPAKGRKSLSEKVVCLRNADGVSD